MSYPLLDLLDNLESDAPPLQQPSNELDPFSELEKERDSIFRELEQFGATEVTSPAPPREAPDLLGLEDADEDLQRKSLLLEDMIQKTIFDVPIPPRPQSSLSLARELLTVDSSYGLPTLLASSSEIRGPSVFTVGAHRVRIQDVDRAFFVRLRPDIAHDDVVVLVEQVLLTNGGMVKCDHKDEGSSVLEVQGAPSCSSLRCLIGVCGHRVRGVLLHLVPQTTTTSLLVPLPALEHMRSLSLSPSSSDTAAHATSPFSRFADMLEAVLGAALHGELMTLGHLSRHVIPIDATLSENGLHESYVQSLEVAMCFEMTEFVATQAAALDAASTQHKRKCARLMTLLRPAYTKAGLPLPNPPTIPNQGRFPEIPAPPATTLERARLLLLRARKKASLHVSHGIPGDESPYFCQVAAELAEVLSIFEDQYEDYSQALLRTKEQFFASKRLAIDSFRIELVQTLLGASQSLRSEALFQHARINDSVLFEGACIFEGKKGILFISAQHLTFHSPGVLLLVSPTTHVFPIASLAALGVLLTASPASLPSSAGSSVEILRITMLGEPQRTFSIALPGATPDHSRRVADLIGCLRSMFSHSPLIPAVVQTNATECTTAHERDVQNITSVAAGAEKGNRIAQKLAALREKSKT